MNPNVMVPLDGSPLAEHALPWAAEIARKLNVPLQIVRAHLPSLAVAAEGFVALYPVEEDEAIRKTEQEYINQIVDKVKQANPELTVIADVIDVEVGFDIADSLATRANDSGSKFVVLTTHGRGPFTRFWLGSVADEFVRQSNVPTLMLRPDENAKLDLGSRPKLKHVLLPVDGSELAEKVIPTATNLGRLFGADFTLLLVLEGVAHPAPLPGMDAIGLPDDWIPNPAIEKANHYLDKLARVLRDQSLNVHLKVIQHESAANCIIDYTKDHANSLVALATHGRTGLVRMFLGSIADKVIRGSTGAVLIVRPPT